MRNHIAAVALVVVASILAISIAAFADDHWMGIWNHDVNHLLIHETQ